MHYTMRWKIKKGGKFPPCCRPSNRTSILKNGLISSSYYSQIPYLTRLEARVLIKKKVHSVKPQMEALQDGGDKHYSLY